MTHSEINEFKKFMTDRHVYIIFATLYRNHRLTINPVVLDSYLEKARPETVIPQAFVYPTNLYGKDFWLEINDEWMRELERTRQTQQNEKCMEGLDLEIIDLKEKQSNLGLPKNTCSLSLRNGNRLTLNMEHSKMVARKNATRMMLTRSRQTADVVLLFNRSKGIEVKYRASTNSLQFNNAELADRLIELLDLDPEKEYFHIGIEVLTETKDNLLFMLKRK